MTDCTEAAPTRLCICCQRTPLEPTQLQTCHRCVGDTRRWITQIVQLYAALDAMLDGYPRRHTSGVRDNPRGGGDGLPGGDALALLAYGGDGGNSAYTDPGSRHDVDDVPSAVWEFERWEADWRYTLEVSAASEPATVTNTSRYLLGQLTWASQHHPEFDEFHHDMRKLHSRMQRVAGSSDQPHRTSTPCLHCGEQLVRHWRDDGLDDEADCPRCYRHYDEQQFREARKAALAEEAS